MDHSWENSDSSPPKGKRKFREALIAVAIVALCLLGVGIPGVVCFSRNQDRIDARERTRAQPDWAAAALIIEAMGTEEGSKALYRDNPKLGSRFKSEREFLAFAAHWRPQLEPLPKDVPGPAENNFGHRHGFGMGPTLLSYRMPKGCWITLQWSGPHTSPSRQLTDLECNP